MDPDSFRLRILWKLPQLPKKKIRKFIELGDRYRAMGHEPKAQLCYDRSLQLAKDIRAVHLMKKIEARVR